MSRKPKVSRVLQKPKKQDDDYAFAVFADHEFFDYATDLEAAQQAAEAIRTQDDRESVIIYRRDEEWVNAPRNWVKL